MKSHSRLPSRGEGLDRQEFYSLCSMHYDSDPNCHMCNTGHWYYVNRRKAWHIIFKLCPGLWRLFANTKKNKEKFLNFDKLR